MIYLFGWNPVAQIILDQLEDQRISVAGIIVDDAFADATDTDGMLPVIPASRIELGHSVKVINCLGYRDLVRRVAIGHWLQSTDSLISFISPEAKIHRRAVIGTGAVLLGDVVIERAAQIEPHALLWGGSRVCHDSIVGEGVFLASGSIIGGGCTIGARSTLGFNASVKQGSHLPPNTKVQANAFWKE